MKGKQMNGKALLKTIEEVKEGETFSIWNLLPTSAGGKEWAGEIKDAAIALSEYINEDEDYELDELRDYGYEYASNCTQSSYKYIHDQNHALSLWACDEIDEEVIELSDGRSQSMTDLESKYYYVAMRMVFDAVADQVFENAEEVEEVDA